MFLAMLWMERWLKFLSEASTQHAPPQLTYTAAGTPEAAQAAGPAEAVVVSMEEARLLQDALDERDQALAGLLLARGELLSELARISGEAAAASTAAERARAAADEAVSGRDAARAERDGALLAERQAWAGENDRLKAAQRRANVQLAAERAAARAERDAWAGEDERLKEAQRQLRVQFAVERADALAAQVAEHAASRADADAAANATLAELRSTLADTQASLAATQASLTEGRNALASSQSALAQAKKDLVEARAEARAEAERLRSEAAADRARAEDRIAHLTAELDAARLAATSAPAAAESPPPPAFSPASSALEASPPTAGRKVREKVRKGKARLEPVQPGSAAQSGDLVVRFRKPADWAETPCVYFWDTDPLTDKPAWPGVPMQAEADGWFVHRFQGVRAAHLIFTDDAGHQTPNMHRTESGRLDADGEWRAEQVQVFL